MTEAKHRSWWSAALVSFFTGPFGGFLWIGSARLALISLALICVVAGYFCYVGIPAFSSGGVDMFGSSSLVLNLLSVALVVPFTRHFQPAKWYSHGLTVFGFAFVALSLAAFVVRSFLFQPFSIPGSSMAPALVPGDHLFVAKYAYGYGRYSVPFGLLPVEGRMFAALPERGDVVVFKFPPDPTIDYIQRIVGLPGEQVQVVGGVLHIDGVPVRLDDAGTYSSGDGPARMQIETLPNGISYTVLDMADGSRGDDTPPFVVPPAHYFMLGDNRDNSSDSRFNVGMVPYENLVGRAARLYWNSDGKDYASRQTVR